MASFQNDGGSYYYPEEHYDIPYGSNLTSQYTQNVIPNSSQLTSYEHTGTNGLYYPSHQYRPSSIADEDESYETSLFLGDLSVYSTEKDIRKLFSPYGIIERIRIKRGSSGKPHLSYGFITFRDRESAERALQDLNGFVLLGRALRLGWAEPKSLVKVPKVKTDQQLKTAQIHVSYISKQIDMLITEETLRQIFSLFGKVVDVALKKSQFDKRLKLQNGYGFVHFPLDAEGIQAAVDATYNIHQVTVDRVTYDCSLSRYLDDYQLPPPRIFPEFARKVPPKPSYPMSYETDPYRHPHNSRPNNLDHSYPTYTRSAAPPGSSTISQHPSSFPQRLPYQQTQFPIADTRNNISIAPHSGVSHFPNSQNTHLSPQERPRYEAHDHNNPFNRSFSYPDDRNNIAQFRHQSSPFNGNEDDLTTTLPLQNISLSIYGPHNTLPVKLNVGSNNHHPDDQSFLEFQASSSSTYSK